MKPRKTIVAVLSVTLILLMASAVIAPVVHWSGLPKIRDIYFKIYADAHPDVVVGEFLDCTTDWIEGPGRSDLYQAVIDAGHIVSPFNNVSEFTFFPMNCRDYKVSSGLPNAPLNDSSWRLALSYIYGMDDKDADIFGYYGVPWFSALGNPVPPAQQPWYDEVTQMPNTDNVTAWNILSAAGYSIADYGGQQWLHRNGVPVRPPDGPNGGVINFWYPAREEVLPQGPGGGLVRNWNGFVTGYLGAEGPLIQISPVAYSTILLELYYLRDFDIVGHRLKGLGRYVRWIHSLCHSSNDVPGGSNFCGVRDPDFDRLTEIIRTNMSESEIIEATENFTRRFVNEVMPWFPAIYGMGFSTTKVDELRGQELTNLIPMKFYGPRNSYSYMCMHWNGTPAAYPGDPGAAWPCTDHFNVALADDPTTMNPWTEYSPFGWEIMARAILTGETGLLAINPFTLRNMPFVDIKYHMVNKTSIPELGISKGCKVTFWLRQDVPWHDNGRNGGEPHYVDADDCVANLEFMIDHRPPRWEHVWRDLVYVEADTPYKFSAYYDKTSRCHASHVSDAALLVPEDIIEIVEPYWDTWDPSNEPYEALGLGPPPTEYPFLKQLVGCGPFVFDYLEWSISISHVTKFEDFFVSAPAIGSVAGEWRVDPRSDYNYEVLIHNIGAKTHDTWGHLTNATVDVAIYHDGELAIVVNDTNLDPWEHKYLPGSTYVYPSVPCPPCVHTITVVVTGSNFRHEYEHEFVTTIREDITTHCGTVLDCKVDMRDIGRASRAFGSSPGHLRWDPCSDINDDFKVDMRDIGAIARRFGWTC